MKKNDGEISSAPDAGPPDHVDLSLETLRPSFLNMARLFEAQVEVQERRYRMRTYKRCFLGGDAVTLLYQMLEHLHANAHAAELNDSASSSSRSSLNPYTRRHAVFLGRALAEKFLIFQHVTNDHLLLDDYFMYKFSKPQDRKMPPSDASGNSEYQYDNDTEATQEYLNNLLEGNVIIDHDNDHDHDSGVFDEMTALGMMMDSIAYLNAGSARDGGHFESPSSPSLVSPTKVQSLKSKLSNSFVSSAGRVFQNAEAAVRQSVTSQRRSERRAHSTYSLTSVHRGLAQQETDLRAAAQALEHGVLVRSHRYLGRSYPNTFIGSDACDFLLVSRFATSRKHAIKVGRALMQEFNLFHHCTGEHDFEDNYLFYEFNPIEDRSRYDDILTANQRVSSLEEISVNFEAMVAVQDRKYRLRSYASCFVGSQAVTCLLNEGYASTRIEAVHLGRLLAKEFNLFQHVAGTDAHQFEDDYFFYRFTSDHDRKQRSTAASQAEAHGGLVLPTEHVPDNERMLKIVASGLESGEYRSSHLSELALTPGEKMSASSKSGPNDKIHLQLLSLVEEFKEGVIVSSHTFRFKRFHKTFVGSEAVDWIVNSNKATCRKEAVELGRRLSEELDLFHHVAGSFRFADDWRLFRFSKDTDDNASASTEIVFPQEKLDELSEAMRRNVKVQSRRWYHKTYKDCFLGSEAVSYLVQSGAAATREDAIQVGRELNKVGNVFEHVEGDHDLKDQKLFYRFVAKELAFQTSDTVSLRAVADLFLQFVEVKDQRYHLRVYRRAFIAKEAIDWLVTSQIAVSRQDAVLIGRSLSAKFHLFEHVTRDHEFADGLLFFRFSAESMRTLWDPDPAAEPDLVVSPSNLTWEEKILEYEKKTRHKEATLKAGAFSSVSNALVWAYKFRRLDPRWRILEFFNEVAQVGVDGVVQGIGVDTIHPLLRFVSRASVFSIWRPTSLNAIRMMMRGEAVGKGLDIKGKSAKKGRLRGYVPFLQISENRHKKFIRTLPKTGVVRLYFGGEGYKTRALAVSKLEDIANEMITTVEEAKGILAAKERANDEDAKEALLWEMIDPSIKYIDDYEPQCCGLEIPIRLLWEVYVVRRDIFQKPGSQYDTGRPSMPAFQDFNIATLLAKPAKQDDPKPVLFHLGKGLDSLSPMDLVMAYEENGRVLPVASDFDGFLVGTRRVHYEPVSGALPQEQLDMLKWCVGNIEKVLDSPSRPENWTNRWLEVLKEEKERGFHPRLPRFGFGDPRSHSITENAIHRLADDGAVRHGAESFNYYFPQEIDTEYLVVSDTLSPISWAYMDVDQLQYFLSDRIDDGFTFPLNPKWIMCDPGWKRLYDKLVADDREDTCNSMKIWFPPEVRAQIEEACARHPDGFQRGIRA